MKKLMTLALVAALLSSAMAFPVSAANSTAGIEFKAGDLDPGDPDDPDKWVPGIEKNLDLYFGEQTIDTATQVYDSQNDTSATPKGEKVGYVVINSTGSTTQEYSLNVAISGFTNNSTPVLNGFSMEMIPDGAVTSALAGNPSTAPVASAETIDAGTSAVIFKTANPGDAQGAWGSNWKAKLTVLGGTALLAGNAQATMTWTLQNT